MRFRLNVDGQERFTDGSAREVVLAVPTGADSIRVVDYGDRTEVRIEADIAEVSYVDVYVGTEGMFRPPPDLSV